MSTNLTLIAVIVGVVAVLAGCGSNQTGTYNGSESVNTPGTAALNESSVSLNISSESNSNVSGTFTDQSGSSSFSGTVSSDGSQIQNVSLSVPAQTSTSTVNGVPSAGCGGTYTGSLSLSNNTISGTLTLTSPQTITPVTGSSTVSTTTNPCQGATRSVTLTKSS